MNSNKEFNFYINHNYNQNNNNIIKIDNINKSNLFIDSDNEEFFKKNYDTEKILIKNDYNIISNATNLKNKDIIDIGNNNSNYYHINYNHHDHTIPINKKVQNNEIQNIDKILKFLKDDKNRYNTSYGNSIYKSEFSSNNNLTSIEELKNQKDVLIIKLKKIKQKNKELMSQFEPYKRSMTNEDIEIEQRLKYIKYLDDKRKEFILINNKLRNKLMKNQNINIKKKIEYLINKQIKEYEKLYNDDLFTNNDIPTKNIYTNNNVEMKCELSLSGVNNNSDYKLNNATTDGLINSKHKNIINENLNNIFYNKKSINKNNKLNKNNSLIFGGEDKNNNNSLKFKKNNSKSNFLSSIKYIKNSKNTRNNNTSSSITSSHDKNINNNHFNKKNDFKLLKGNSKMTNGLNFGIK